MSDLSALGEALKQAFPGIDESLLPPAELGPPSLEAVPFCEECGARPYDFIQWGQLFCTGCLIGAAKARRPD